MVNDTTTLNGALSELGETLATNITAKGVSASASDGLTTLASKVLQISGGGGGSTTLFEDKCDSASGLSNYGSSISLRNGGTSTLTYDSTENAYKLTCTKSSSESMIPISILDGYTGDFTITLESEQKGSMYTSRGIIVYIDSNNWYKVGEGGDRIWTGQKVNGTYSESSKTFHYLTGAFTVVCTVDNAEHTLNIKTYQNDVVVADGNFTIDIASVSNTVQYGLVSNWNNGDNCYFYNIKAESLGGGSDCSQYQTEISNAIEYINGSGS